ncbi:hypothetical protein HanPI659440_Chr04g0164451 [Helianthus annuus]|nr:hypothetical protein HanPI659440_Chr04g0164451 [Helianthus annuus]
MIGGCRLCCVLLSWFFNFGSGFYMFLRSMEWFSWNVFVIYPQLDVVFDLFCVS